MTLSLSEALAPEGRYHRQQLVEWWDQARVSSARFLVVGAGALGNEVLKILALMGAGPTLVFDPDVIERSNLARTVLFRESDEGQGKAEVAARRMRELNPGARVHARAENVVTHAGLGVFLWADVVVGAVDNREARVFVNSACARAGRRWVDGAIEGFSGIVRAFDPAGGACYECTMNATDRKLLAERRSCAMLARDVVAAGHVPSTAVAASIVGAMQAQEALKLLHEQPALVGEGLHLNGLWNDVSRVRYPRKDECPGHDRLGDVTVLAESSEDVTLAALLARAESELGEGATLEFSRDVIVKLTCPGCGAEARAGVALGAMSEKAARCPSCGEHRVVDSAASFSKDDPVIDPAATPAALGLPRFDVIVARNGLDGQRAWLLGGDAPHALGPLQDTFRGGKS